MAGKGRVNPVERTERAQSIHTDLDAAAAAINAFHAQILSRVIEAKDWKVHCDIDGFGGLCEWLKAKFDFHHRVAADLAAIARHANKFSVLAEAATSGAARIDQVALAVRRLDRTPALKLYAATPYREAVPSPFDPATVCAIPEALIAQYCQHASHDELSRHLDRIEAACAGEDELFEGLSEQALARLEVWETDTGMWAVDGLLASDTGALFAKLLTTAVPPPRQDQADAEDQAVPAAANRNAEALHQVIASFGADAKAPTRHGHTATLHLSVDIDTLRGVDTGRIPTLEGRPISLAKARYLACEAGVIPSIFDYGTGEAVELGRTMRLPNTALRRKLELEQPEGCAWTGCNRPVHWTEAHHVREWWAEDGETNADNLILLCRFHHGRVHTPGWSITKTGPGQAIIVHHHGHEPAPADMTEHAGPDGCGCADWRTDTDLETDFQDDVSNVFPTGLYPTEWAPALKDDLNRVAEQAETSAARAAAKTARAQARARFTTETATRADGIEPRPVSDPRLEEGSELEPAYAATASDLGPPPFLHRPAGRPAGEAPHIARDPNLQGGVRALAVPTAPTVTDRLLDLRPTRALAARAAASEVMPRNYPTARLSVPLEAGPRMGRAAGLRPWAAAYLSSLIG